MGPAYYLGESYTKVMWKQRQEDIEVMWPQAKESHLPPEARNGPFP